MLALIDPVIEPVILVSVIRGVVVLVSVVNFCLGSVRRYIE